MSSLFVLCDKCWQDIPKVVVVFIVGSAQSCLVSMSVYTEKNHGVKEKYSLPVCCNMGRGKERDFVHTWTYNDAKAGGLGFYPFGR